MNAEVLNVSGSARISEWILDSGCSYHMSQHGKWINVRRVPGLEMNLVFLGMLDDSGSTYSANGGMLNVYMHNILVMSDRNVNGMYVLNGFIFLMLLMLLGALLIKCPFLNGIRDWIT